MQMRERLIAATGVTLLALMNLAASATPAKLYAAIFGVTVGESGELVSFRLDKVIDPQSKSAAAVNVSVPESYIAAARDLVLAKRYEPKLKDGTPVEFFTWF